MSVILAVRSTLGEIASSDTYGNVISRRSLHAGTAEGSTRGAAA